MQTLIDIVLRAGHSAVDVALYTLLPIMVAMMILMRLLEVHGALEKLIQYLAPVARPFGLTGLGILAMIQISFVSSFAPLPTLALMEGKGATNRHLAATFASVLAMANANAAFPLSAIGVQLGVVLGLSVVGGFVAAATTYWLFGRRLSNARHATITISAIPASDKSLLKIISTSGAEAIQVTINIIPMLLLSLTVVLVLQETGAVDRMICLMDPLLIYLGVNSAIILPTITKYLAGSTALVGLLVEMHKQGQLPVTLLHHYSGFLIHPLDLVGVTVLATAGPRVAKVCLPAMAGASVGVAVRSIGTGLLAPYIGV